VAADLDLGRRQERLRERARGYPHRRLPGARPLEHVPEVVGQVLEGAREIGVAGPRIAEDTAGRLGGGRLGRHHVAPVLEVPVADEERDGAAQRLPVADAGEDLDRVLLDLHAAAAAVAPLAAPEVRVDEGAVHGDARGKPFHDHGQGGPVRLAGGEEAEHSRIGD
jgi:hypothetical protein